MNIKGSKHLTLGKRIAIAELLVQNSKFNYDLQLAQKEYNVVLRYIRTGHNCLLKRNGFYR